jgi:hypothetical protein
MKTPSVELLLVFFHNPSHLLQHGLQKDNYLLEFVAGFLLRLLHKKIKLKRCKKEEVLLS